MPEAAVAADLDEPLDVETDLSPEIALNFVPLVDDLSDSVYLVIGEITNLDIRIDPGLRHDPSAQDRANAIDAA